MLKKKKSTNKKVPTISSHGKSIKDHLFCIQSLVNCNKTVVMSGTPMIFLDNVHKEVF